MPDGFGQACLDRSIDELKALYCARDETVVRWLGMVSWTITSERRMNMIDRYENSRNYAHGKRGWQSRDEMAAIGAATLSEMG